MLISNPKIIPGGAKSSFVGHSLPIRHPAGAHFDFEIILPIGDPSGAKFFICWKFSTHTAPLPGRIYIEEHITSPQAGLILL